MRERTNDIRFPVAGPVGDPTSRALADVTDPQHITIVEMNMPAEANAGMIGISLGQAIDRSRFRRTHGVTREDLVDLASGRATSVRGEVTAVDLVGNDVAFTFEAVPAVGPNPDRRYVRFIWTQADATDPLEVEPDDEVMDLAQLITSGVLAEAPFAVAIMDDATNTYVTANHAFGDLLGVDRRALIGAPTETGVKPGISLGSQAGRATEILRGGLDSFTVTFTVPDAPTVARTVTISVIGPRQPRARYLVAYVYDSSASDVRPEHARAPETGSTPLPPGTFSIAVVDAEWRLQGVNPDPSRWGVSSSSFAGYSIIPAIQPSDLPALMEAGERVRTDQELRVVLRVHYRVAADAYTFFPVECEISHDPQHPSGWLTLAAAARDTVVAENAADDRLRSITMGAYAQEPEALPTDERTAAATARVAAEFGLTARETDIVRLLVDGYRVTTMSRTLHLSAGTIRNYLSGVFHKVGVHGQAELIEFIRSRTDPA